jgi:hypothetical protein
MSSSSGNARSGSSDSDIDSSSSSGSSSSGKARTATTPVKARSNSSSSSSSSSGGGSGSGSGKARAGSSSSSARNLGSDFAAAAAAAAAAYAAPPKINKFRKGQHEPWPGWPERCLCDTAPMKRAVSHTAKNPGRVFLTCTNPACGKFDWLDPRCACGLICQPKIVVHGQPQHRGRMFYKCSRSTCR